MILCTGQLHQSAYPKPMSLRIGLIRALAQELDEEHFQPNYHKKPHGRAVAGWGERLSSYFWPNPEVDYAYTLWS